jgi:hypothetical protein
MTAEHDGEASASNVGLPTDMQMRTVETAFMSATNRNFPSAVLWRVRNLTCTCMSAALEHVEIRLIVNGIVISNDVFSDSDSASRRALDLMQAYGAR